MRRFYKEDTEHGSLRLKIHQAQAKNFCCVLDIRVVELLHVTPSQAYRILRKLKDAGQLSLEGNGAGARYRTAK